MIAFLAGRQALVLLRLRTTIAEGNARIDMARPGGLQSQRAQDGTSEHSPQSPQRFAAGHRLGKRFGEFVEEMVHDRVPFVVEFVFDNSAVPGYKIRAALTLTLFQRKRGCG